MKVTRLLVAKVAVSLSIVARPRSEMCRRHRRRRRRHRLRRRHHRQYVHLQLLEPHIEKETASSNEPDTLGHLCEKNSIKQN